MTRLLQLRRWLNRNNLHVDRVGASLYDLKQNKVPGLDTPYICVESFYSLWTKRPVVTRVWTEWSAEPPSADRAAGR